MKQIFTQIFVSLGVIFLMLIIVGVYFFITDPYNLKSLIFGSGPTKNAPRVIDTENTTTRDTTGGTSDTMTTGGFQLSEAQKQALISFGIDPTAVPSSLSAEQETCFINAFGEGRVTEIKAGAVPNAMEFFKAKTCI